MAARTRRGLGPSHLLITPDRAGNVVGIDPHKRTLSAAVVDARGGLLAGEHFRVSGEGHRALVAWACSFGPVARWGVENASGWGRHTAIFLTGRGQDVRDVCPNRTARADRARQRGKSDTLDAERVARELLAHPLLPKAFKRAADQPAGPDPRGPQTLGMPEQPHGMLGVVGIDRDDAEFGAADRGTGQHVRSRIDTVGQPARLAGEIEIQRLDRGVGRLGVAAVQSLQNCPAGEREEDDRRVAQTPGEVQCPVVGDGGAPRVTVLEQDPTEPCQ